MKVLTEYHGSWVDSRGRVHHEWTAIDDETYGGPEYPMGLGATEIEAVSDLYDQMEEFNAKWGHANER